jgi:glycosyltransferase 2 family protein
MQKRLLSILQFGIFFGIGIFLVWWSIYKLSDKDYQDFLTALKTANYYLLIPVFFILSASHVSRAIRWKILMGGMGYNPKLSNTFCAVMVGYLANYAFPRLGEVLKCTILGKYEKVPADKLVGTIFVERAVDLFSFFIIILISLLTQASIVGAYTKKIFEQYLLSQDITVTIIKISILLLFLIGGFFLSKYIFKKYRHIKPIQKIEGIFNGVIEGLLSVKKMKNKWRFIFHSVFIWTCYVLGTYVGFLAMKETADLPVLATFPVLVFGTVAMIVTPGGIGAYPELLMKAMLLYNIKEGFGNANGWLQWSAQFIIILVVGFVCLAILPYINKPKNEDSKLNTK